MTTANIPNPAASLAPDWLASVRTAGQARLGTVGLPTGKEESWRFTQIKPVVTTHFESAGVADPVAVSELFQKYTFGHDAGVEVVFVNGRFAPEVSRIDALPKGLTVRTFRDIAQSGGEESLTTYLNTVVDIHQHQFAAMNAANLDDGAYVHVRRGVTIDRPIHFLFISVGGATPTVTHPRIFVITEANSEATFVESFVGSGSKYLSNAVSEYVVGDDARIDHCKLQQESNDAYHVAAMQVQIGRATQFVSHAITTGGAVSRNDLGVKLAGQGGYATLNGLVMLGGSQHCDNHTLLDHAAPDCPSHELYKHVLDGKSTCVFKGKIFVHQIAQKTNAKQSGKALLLSDTAEMNAQPALEIYADDVKCTHGSTTGPIDEDLVFYLRSRGVGINEARHLLTYAFAADVTRRIKVEPVRRRIEDFMAEQAGLPQDLRINDLAAFDQDVTR